MPASRSFFLRRPSSAATRFARNALWLIAVNLFMRTVGVSFNVYLSTRAGGEVMGLYTLLFGVYGPALTLGCGGIHLGTTRLVAEAMGEARLEEIDGENCRRSVRRCLRRCLTYSVCCGMGAGLLLLWLAPMIGAYWLGDLRTVTSLRVLAITLPFASLSSCLGGYFTAVRRITPNAVVGMGTQLIRIACCSYLLTLWLPDGVEATCLALVLGGTLSEILGFLATYVAYRWDKHRHLRVSNREETVSDGLTRKLLGITVPVTLSACLRSGLLSLQHILIPRGLKQSGASWAAALASYGVIQGMVLPVVLFPSAFISSFSGLLVPEVAESHARGDDDRVARISTRIVTLSLIFSFGVAGIMACFAYELGTVVCGSAEAGKYIRLLAPLIPIMYVDSSVDAVLKGMNEQVYSMNVNIADALCSVILVWLLLPRVGLMGYMAAIYATETLNTTLSLTRMLRVSGMKVALWRQVFGPLLCITGATCLMRWIGPVLPWSNGDNVPGLVFHIILTSLLYLFFLAITGVWFPFPRKHKEKKRLALG